MRCHVLRKTATSAQSRATCASTALSRQYETWPIERAVDAIRHSMWSLVFPSQRTTWLHEYNVRGAALHCMYHPGHTNNTAGYRSHTFSFVTPLRFLRDKDVTVVCMCKKQIASTDSKPFHILEGVEAVHNFLPA